MQARLDRNPVKMRERRQTVEHPFGTIKSWMGATHFQMKTLKNVSTEMALHVLAYNMKRVISILGVGGLMEAIRARARQASLCRACLPKKSRFHTGWVKSCGNAQRLEVRIAPNSGHRESRAKPWVRLIARLDPRYESDIGWLFQLIARVM